MGFGDLRSDSGLRALNDYLKDKSYIDGFVPSQADVVVFSALAGPPDWEHVHARRWYNQIASYGDEEKKQFVGVKKDLAEYGPLKTESAAANDDDDDDDDDDDVDLFGDDDEDDEERERIKEERRQKYAEKKSTKPAVTAKSNIILDVKPWDDETDMAELEKKVRSVATDGLLWGSSKLVPVAYGIKKLQISCVVEDDKVGTDFLEDSILEFDDFIQSVDIAAFNKI
ncbi:elongation factor 1-beta-like [Oscarella lobularis]|uniref:elongation factor 1-beta-like n=1 Tax=Oscarella lobularis TaxID=121494 RepID=UPI003313BA3B